MTDLTLSIIRPFYLVYVFWLFLKLRTKTEKNAFSRFKTVEYLFLFLACGLMVFMVVRHFFQFSSLKRAIIYYHCAKSVFSYFIFSCCSSVYDYNLHLCMLIKGSFYSLKKLSLLFHSLSQKVSHNLSDIYGFGQIWLQ